MDSAAHQTLPPGQVQQNAASSDSSITSDLILFTLTAGDIFTLRIEEYILSDKPTVRKDCRVLRIDQHPQSKRQVQIWYSYTWTARNGVTHNEDDGVLDIKFENGMSNLHSLLLSLYSSLDFRRETKGISGPPGFVQNVFIESG
jgi:hypothetical protein